jgi:hypothetical protein
MIKDIKYFIYLGIAMYIIDIVTSNSLYYTCINRIDFHIVSIIHHIYNIFLLTGWLSNDINILSIYVVVNLLNAYHWLTNRDLCGLTEYTNKMCNIKHDEYFRDILYILGIKKIDNYVTYRYIYVILSTIIAIYKIRKTK